MLRGAENSERTRQECQGHRSEVLDIETEWMEDPTRNRIKSAYLLNFLLSIIKRLSEKKIQGKEENNW